MIPPRQHQNSSGWRSKNHLVISIIWNFHWGELISGEIFYWPDFFWGALRGGFIRNTEAGGILQESLFSLSFMRIKFDFCPKEMKIIQTIKLIILFRRYSINTAHRFLYCKIMPVFSFGTIKRITCFSGFELSFET